MTTHDIRENLGMTQQEFADYLGVSYRKVTAWDSRESFPEWAAALIMQLVEANREILLYESADSRDKASLVEEVEQLREKLDTAEKRLRIIQQALL